MDPQTHRRYLDYRERHVYFGASTRLLALMEFSNADAELRALETSPERDDEGEERRASLAKLLFRD